MLVRRRGEEERGRGQRRGVLQTSRHLDWRKGGLEVVVGRGVNGRLLCLALQSMQMAGVRGFSRAPARPLVSGVCRKSKQEGGRLWMLCNLPRVGER